MSKYINPVIESFLKGENKKIANTESKDDKLYLFDNVIAKFKDSKLYITTSSWNTLTTRDRLNKLPNVSVKVSKGILYIKENDNWNKWDGSWKKID